MSNKVKSLASGGCVSHTGEVPNAEMLAAMGVQSFSTENATPQVRTTPGRRITQATTKKQQPLLAGPSEGRFPALLKKLVGKDLIHQYIEFAELPLGKGKNRQLTQALEGQVLVVQEADLLQTRKVIPDLATWSQCLALYVAVLPPHQLGRIAHFMAYQAMIAKTSMKYKWPVWIVYDQNFWQEVAGATQSWAKVDPSIYAVCFTGHGAQQGHTTEAARGAICQKFKETANLGSNADISTSAAPAKSSTQ